MWFAVISLFPESFTAIKDSGITSRAFANNQAQLTNINPRDFTKDNYRRVDERPYGGGAGMVMMAEPLAKAISHAKQLAKAAGLQNVPVVYLSPQGKQLSENLVVNMLDYDGMILLCGRYDGVDERLLSHYVDFECSIGDYVLSGGELAAMVLMDSVIRKLPNVLGDDNSAVQDSFVAGLLDYPQYTKPDVFESVPVPAVLKSGNHAGIAKWRFLQQYERTKVRRPDLIQRFKPNKQQLTWLNSQAEE